MVISNNKLKPQGDFGMRVFFKALVFCVYFVAFCVLVSGSVMSQEKSDSNTKSETALKTWVENYNKEFGKIRDPYDPRFDPNSFRFEDYPSQCMMKEVLSKLFPIGISKEFVDRVLAKAGGASITKVPEQVGYNKYSYFKNLKPGPLVFMSSDWNIGISYDENNKVKDIHIPGGKPPGQSVYDFFKDCEFGKQYGKKWGAQ